MRSLDLGNDGSGFKRRDRGVTNESVHTAASRSPGTTLPCANLDVSVVIEKILNKGPWCDHISRRTKEERMAHALIAFSLKRQLMNLMHPQTYISFSSLSFIQSQSEKNGKE